MIKKTDYNRKITEIENKIPSVTGLVTTVTCSKNTTEIENKIDDVANLAKKNALSTKTTEF